MLIVTPYLKNERFSPYFPILLLNPENLEQIYGKDVIVQEVQTYQWAVFQNWIVVTFVWTSAYYSEDSMDLSSYYNVLAKHHFWDIVFSL